MEYGSGAGHCCVFHMHRALAASAREGLELEVEEACSGAVEHGWLGLEMWWLMPNSSSHAPIFPRVLATSCQFFNLFASSLYYCSPFFFEETGGVLPYWLIILELEKLQKSLEIKKQKRETKKIRNIMEIILFSFFTCMCYWNNGQIGEESITSS